MFGQTIALLRYQLIGIINSRLLIALLLLIVVGVVLSQFVSELAIINSEQVALSVLSEFLRYGLVFLVMTYICFHISQAYELAHFERILSMPFRRGQYIAAQVLVVLTLSFIVSTSVFIACLFYTTVPFAFYWFIAVFLELVLSGLFALLAILSLEKLPLALLLSIAIYFLSKVVPIIDASLFNAAEFYSEELSFRFTGIFFSLLQYVLPGRYAFAQNDMLFEGDIDWALLQLQALSVILYSVFLIFISTVDFYRKEFRT